MHSNKSIRNLNLFSRRQFIQLAAAAGLITACSSAEPQAWSVRMADTLLKRHPVLADKWRYEAGVVLTGIKQMWLKTREQKYYDYIKSNIDPFIGPDGEIKTYRLEDYNLDQINEGKLLFLLYQQTGDERYRQAAYLLRKQLQTQPRTSEGGFWHKQIYPRQMWLDGLYMAAPFFAEFAQTFGEPDGFDEVVQQLTLVERHARDPQTGLLYHGWDESKRERWANPETGCSPCFWGRAVGWYMLAIVDVLDFLPSHHPGRESLVAIFERTASVLTAVRDNATGLWYQVLDQGDRPGNYLEASASAMFVYALAKGVRQGYIDEKYRAVAAQGYQGILDRFVEIDTQGLVNLNGICAVAGLGGDPYRDGSFEYYTGEKSVANDYKGIGPFMMASVEMETVIARP